MNADKTYQLTKKASEAKFLTPQDYLKSKIKKKKFDLPELDKIFNNNTKPKKKAGNKSLRIKMLFLNQNVSLSPLLIERVKKEYLKNKEPKSYFLES